MTAYSWRRRSLTTEHSAAITLARRTDGCDVCAGLGRPRTTTGRPCVHCGAPVDDTLLLVVDSTEDQRRLYALDGRELPVGLGFEEVAVGDEHVGEIQLAQIEEFLEAWLGHRNGWDLERLWGEP